MTEAADSEQADGALAVSAANAFAVDIYKRLAPRDGDLAFSPASVAAVLAMAYSAAQAETAQEMAEVLHLTLPPRRNDRAAGRILKSLQIRDEGLQLRAANAVWLNARLEPRPAFRDALARDYGSPVRRLDVSGDGEAGRAQINSWVGDETDGRITDLVPSGTIGNHMSLVLASALYLKARWLRPFHAAATSPQPFYLASGGSTPIPLMRNRLGARHIAAKTFQALELPYRGEDLSMIILLPTARDGLADFEVSLDAAELQRLLGQLRVSESAPVDVSLPKFTLNRAFAMRDLLIRLGMKRAFTDQAQFDMADEAVAISEARHETFLAVDELGTEAAAATVGLAVATAAHHYAGPPPVQFRADHPFVFVIRDNRSEAMLFMGRFTGHDLAARSTEGRPSLAG